MPGFVRHIVTINVSVSWEEGHSTEFVRRTTYAFNQINAAEAYQSQEAQDAAEEEERRKEEGDEDDFDDEDDEEEGFE